MLHCPAAVVPGTSTPEPHDTLENGLDGAVQASDGQPQAGHAHEPEDQEGPSRTMDVPCVRQLCDPFSSIQPGCFIHLFAKLA